VVAVQLVGSEMLDPAGVDDAPNGVFAGGKVVGGE